MLNHTNSRISFNIHYLLLCFALFNVLHNACAAPPFEQDVLLNLKKIWKDPKLALETWIKGNECWNWTNIFCDTNDHVEQIYLSFLELSGPLPDSIGNFKSLQSLWLDGNEFSGAIPDSIGNLESLTELHLESNQLSGAIPASIGNLTNLTDVLLFSNQLSGHIPFSIGNLINLRNLYLYSNQLSGPIPSSIGNLTSIEQLWLDSNKLTGIIPTSIGNLTSLTVLALCSNQLTGAIPSSMGNLESLSRLLLYNNHLSGPIPSSFGNFKVITEIDIGNNMLSGEIPKTFQNLRSISKIYFRMNNLRGASLDFTLFGKLTKMDLSYNGFVGEIKLPKFAPLTRIDLSNNYLNNSFPSGFDYFSNSNFTYIDLSRNQFSGSYPLLPDNTSMLTFASFAYNKFTGKLPKNQSNSKIYYYGNPSCQIDSTNCKEVTFEYRSNFSSIKSIKNCSSPEFYLKCNACKCGVHPFTATIKVYNVEFNDPSGYVWSIENIWNKSIPSQQVLVRSATVSYSSFSVDLEIYVVNDNIISNNSVNESETSQKNRFLDALVNSVGAGIRLNYYHLTDSGKYYILRFDANIPLVLQNITNDSTTSNVKHVNSSTKKIIVITLSVSAFLILAIIAYTIFVAYKILKEAKLRLLEKELEKTFLQNYSIAVITQATDNFSDERLLGSGGFGSVYRGVSQDGEVWAVKRANPESTTTLEVFQKEVLIVSKISHLHLVKLIGFCDEMDEKILVYEFASNGTLQSHLSPKTRVEGENMVLSFEQRLNIALESAEGLNYLHTFAQPPIIHRDIKSENILLDSYFQAKLADFGFAKHFSSLPSFSQSAGGVPKPSVVGTIGYMDPEYFTTGVVTFKSDVHSFGVVLMELLTGKPPVFSSKIMEGDEFLKVSLSNWAVSLIDERDMISLMDPLLGNNYNTIVAFNFARLAARCVERQSNLRPTMEEVVLALRSLKDAMLKSTEDPVINENRLLRYLFSGRYRSLSHKY